MTYFVMSHDQARQRAIQCVQNAPEGYVVQIKEPNRNLAQNALLWSLLNQVSDQVMWHGKKLTSENWKDVFSASLKNQQVVPGIDGGFVVCGQSTSKMSKAQWAVARTAVSELSKRNVTDDLAALAASTAAAAAEAADIVAAAQAKAAELAAAAAAASLIPGVGAIIAAILLQLAALIVLIAQIEAEALTQQAAAKQAAAKEATAARNTERLSRSVAVTPCGTPANPCTKKRKSSASPKSPDGNADAGLKRAAPSSSAMDRLSGGSSAPASDGAPAKTRAKTRASGWGGAGATSSGSHWRSNPIRISPGTEIRATPNPSPLR